MKLRPLISSLLRILSNIMTLVLLFLILSSISKASQILASNLSTQSCLKIYAQKVQKQLVFAPEIAPVSGIWDKPEYYHPSTSNRIFNNLETRNLDQRYSRECFLFAFLGALESAHMNRAANTRNIKLSASYLVARKLEHAIFEILTDNASRDYFKLDGGETYHAMKVAEKYGLIPEDIWSPRKPLEEWKFNEIYSEIIEHVNTIIADRNINPGNYINKSNQAMTQEIFTSVLGKYVGNFPTKPFYYNGIYHANPQSFAKLYGIDSGGEIGIKYLNLGGPYQDYNQTLNLPYYINPLLSQRKFSPLHRAEDAQTVFQDVKKALANGRAIMMDVDGYDSVVGHTFVITDVEVFPNGRIKALKLKNSYSNWGNNGYSWFHVDKVAPVVRRIWIFDVNSSIPVISPNPISN